MGFFVERFLKLLHLDAAARVPELMMEGTSVRAISRLTGIHIATILSLMVTAGEKCQRLLDATIRNVRPNLVQADELHSLVGCHEKRPRPDAPAEWGSIWTWLALDSESKLIISYHIGNRDAESAWEFMRDLRARTEGIFQLTSDGFRAYVDAVDAHFATSIHFAQLIKLYSSPDISGPDWYSATSRVTGTIPSVKVGRPDARFVSTSKDSTSASGCTFVATPAERTPTAANWRTTRLHLAFGLRGITSAE